MSKPFYILAGFSVALLALSIEAAVLPDFSKLSPGDSFGGEFPSSLRLLGTVEGKNFFVETEPGRTWSQAKAYCTSSGMKLASIKSPGQATFLNQSYDATYFNAFFWTSGRDAHLLRQFSWDSDETEPQASYVSLSGGNPGINSALQYYSNSGTSSLRYYSTSDTTSGVLCES